MSISEKYIGYLDHFGETVTIRELWANPEARGLCGLRHDVDHDLDLALEMGHLECEKGFRSTYFILPGTGYWLNDSKIIEKCLQLQDYGHEVGLHINSLVEWFVEETDDIGTSLSDQLARLRDGGIDVRGIAAHGDKRCYLENVSNYWCFEELRPKNPFGNEDGRTAEGPYEMDMTPRLRYPKSDRVTRKDGSVFDLWTISLSSNDLDYHAWHVDTDAYFTDSGGRWQRSVDPLSVRRTTDRWQVLIHPEHWLGSAKLYFFLSPARSGSKWLNKLLNEATPIKARHEHLLNQNYSSELTARKNTSNVRMLEDNPKIVRDELVRFWEEWKDEKKDIAEVNVYLPNFANDLREIFPEACFVHLKRRDVDVVNSLVARNWYDTPEDHAHPKLKFADSKALNQIERVCFYVKQTNECLSQLCDHKISLEQLNENILVLQDIFRELKIPLHPRLASSLIGNKVDPSKVENKIDFSKADDSPFAKTFDNIFNLSCQDSLQKIPSSNVNRNSQAIEIRNKKEYVLKNLLFKDINGEQFLSCVESSKHSYLSFFGCTWYSVGHEHSGLDVLQGKYISGELSFQVPEPGVIQIFGVSFDADGKAFHRRQCGMVDHLCPTIQFAFAPHPEAATIDLIIYRNYKSGPSIFNCSITKFFWN